MAVGHSRWLLGGEHLFGCWYLGSRRYARMWIGPQMTWDLRMHLDLSQIRCQDLSAAIICPSFLAGRQMHAWLFWFPSKRNTIARLWAGNLNLDAGTFSSVANQPLGAYYISGLIWKSRVRSWFGLLVLLFYYANLNFLTYKIELLCEFKCSDINDTRR